MWLRGDLDQRWCPGGPGRDALRGLGWGEPRALSLSGEVPEAPSPALSTPRDVGLNWGHRNGGCLGVAGGLKGEGASASPQRGLAQETPRGPALPSRPFPQAPPPPPPRCILRTLWPARPLWKALPSSCAELTPQAQSADPEFRQWGSAATWAPDARVWTSGLAAAGSVFSYFFLALFFSWSHLRHMEISQAKDRIQVPAVTYATATVTPDP